MRPKRTPVAEIGMDGFRIVRHTHDVELATSLMQARLNQGMGSKYVDEFGPPLVGTPRQVWCRIQPCLPNSDGAAEGWAFEYRTDAGGPGRGVFPAVVFE